MINDSGHSFRQGCYDVAAAGKTSRVSPGTVRSGGFPGPLGSVLSNHMEKVSGNNSTLGTGLCHKSGDSTLPVTSVWRPAQRARTWRQDLVYGMILAVVDCGAI